MAWQVRRARIHDSKYELMRGLGRRAGYPEGHADSDDKNADVDYLLEKQRAGADFVVTQLFYDTDAFMSWFEACRAKGALASLLGYPALI